MSTTGQTLSALRTLGYSAQKLADLITYRIDDAEVRSQVRAACLLELAWVDTLLAGDDLRLTDAEREAVETSFDAMQYAADELGLSQADCDRLVATLRGLLERMA